jgi:hypothetical protein
MTITLRVPNPDLRALASGETIVAFVPTGTVAAGDAVDLAGSGPRPTLELKPAYRRWASCETPPGHWTATVEAVAAAQSLDPDAGHARHVLTETGEGDLVVLRMKSDRGPVLSDEAYAARRASLEAAMRS